MEQYNGWRNVFTWIVNLWINNEEGSANDAAERAADAYRNAQPRHGMTRAEAAAIALADELKSEYTDTDNGIAPAVMDSASMYGDMMQHAAGMVDWHEIAASMIEDLDTAEFDAEDNED